MGVGAGLRHTRFQPLRREPALEVLEAAFAGLGLIDKKGVLEGSVVNKTRTWSREVGNEELDRLEECIAHVERDIQRVVMFPQREATDDGARMK